MTPVFQRVGTLSIVISTLYWLHIRSWQILLGADRQHAFVRMLVAQAGTVAVTAVGMFGHSSGWALAPSWHTLGLAVGNIASKLVVVGGRIEPREILSLTVAFDHDVVDGAPAARFVRRLLALIESGYGLAVGQPA
jgi:pyruvate/2-oxoglutarate dehydrogenase complex dihydrolipoamide acyltransferase (E2) component